MWRIAQHFYTTTEAILRANPLISETYLRVGQIICIPQQYRFQRMPSIPVSADVGKPQQALSDQMRLLWEQHVYWTRMLILSMASELPDTESVANRLLRNPKDFEAALRPFYGQDIATKFAELLTNHLIIASGLVKAAKAGDSAAAAAAEKQWYANADEIAAFLGRINPFWSAKEWQRMLYDHLAMTKAEAVAILTQKYEDSINIFEDIEQEALKMADTMTQGIQKQYPQRFSQDAL